MRFGELERRMKNACLIEYKNLSGVPKAAGVYTAWLDGEILL